MPAHLENNQAHVRQLRSIIQLCFNFITHQAWNLFF